ncbi:MAG TPA: HAD-IB family phosphatase [Steroidobacteraceae bacterium]|nr:HAD-IB family phosphatase [Steroidobacteraceae bacterium]
MTNTGSRAKPRRLAVFDLDGTLSRADTFGPFVLGLLRRHPARVLRVPLLLLPVIGYVLRLMDRGGLKGAILHVLFAGLSRAEVGQFARQYAQTVVPDRLFPAALAALRKHLADQDHVVLLSASPDLYVPDIGAALGVDETICTQVRWNGEQLDGRLAGLNRRDQEKLRVLEGLKQQHPGLSAIAYGNSRADLPHMFRCEQAVYVNAAPALGRELGERGVQCVNWR